MYRCSLCKTTVQSNRPAIQVIAEIRRVSYPMRVAAIPLRGRRKKKGRKDDPGGSGWEAARIDLVCEACLPQAEARLAELIAAE